MRRSAKGIMKKFSYTALILNAVALIIYLLTFFGVSILNSTSSILFLVVIGINFVLVNLNFKFANREDPWGGKWIKNVSWIYLFTCFFAVLLLGISELIYIIANGLPYLIPISVVLAFNLISYLIFYGVGLLTVSIDIRYIDRLEAWILIN